MKSYHNNSIPDFLQGARLAITNAQQTPEIAEALVLFGLDATALQAGADLLSQAEALQAAQVQQYSEQYAATEARDEAWQAADKSYMVHRKLARLALKDQPQAQKALLLHKPKERTLSDWLAQSKVFYTNLLGNDMAKTALAKYNLTEEKLTSGLNAVDQVQALEAVQKQQTSEAQQATKERNAVLNALNERLVELREVAQIALADTPQQLEALGFGRVS